MWTMKLRIILKVLVVFSYLFILLSAITMPHFERAQPDPYFQFKNMPIAYWLGISTSLIASILSIFSRENKSNCDIGLSALFSLVLLTDITPMLMYRNKIWLDSYPYVSEVVNILKTNHIGAGHALETPSLSLFASQFSLITGINYITIAEFIPLLISLLIVLFTYLVAKAFIDERAAIITVLVYIGFNTFGIWFNRGSLSLVIQLITWYCLIKLIISRSRSWHVLILLSFFSLTLTHPTSSFFVVITILASSLFISIYPSVFKILKKDNISLFNFFDQTQRDHLLYLFFEFFIIWSAWFIIVNHLTMIVERIYKIFRILPGGITYQIYPTVYTPEYYSIVMLIFYELLFGVIIGSILTLFYIIKGKYYLKLTIISSWFMSAMFGIAFLFIMQLSEYTDRLFSYSFPALGMLISWFILKTNFKKRILTILGKTSLMIIISSFIIMLPLTMLPHMSFVYPSTANLQFDDFLTTKTSGSVGVFAGHEDLYYYSFINKGLVKIDSIYNASASGLSYRVIAVTFRAYAKTAYEIFQPPMAQSLKELDEELSKDPKYGFSKIYIADEWQIIYSKNIRYRR